MASKRSSVRAISIHTGSFPPDGNMLPRENRRSSWRQRADSIIINVQRRLSARLVLSDEQAQIDDITKSLSSKELETAARTSYDYLLDTDNATLKKKSVQAAVQRVLRSKDHCKIRTQEALRLSLAFRQSMKIDDLRLAFSVTEGRVLQDFQPLYEHLSSGMVYVQGYDKQGRSTYVFVPSRVTNSQSELEWTIRMHVYTLERAIACSKCPEKRVNAVVNFQNFAIKNRPPMDLGIEFLTTFRDHYSGHVNQIFLIDAPRTFLCLWTVFAPFLAAKTKKRIHFVSGKKQKRKIVGGLYENDQAPSWMLPGGTLNRSFDARSYLLVTPFDKSFAEE
ncbi:hypothetical protein MPSEU_000485000 [Mayamaea pseudoterrestris]|nr:hypothetical protein MPSEU_000485000 [Mayamaea pseudoterrestris]